MIFEFNLDNLSLFRWGIGFFLAISIIFLYLINSLLKSNKNLAKKLSERETIEKESRDAEIFLNSIVENLPHMVFVKDAKELKFLRFNKAGEKLLGYSREEMLGKSDYDFFPKEEADFFTTKDRQVLAGCRCVDIPEENLHTRLKGIRILHTKKIPILDSSGEPQYLLGISEDITEKKKAEAAAKETETMYRQILDAIADMVLVKGPHSRIVWANRSFREYYGMTNEELRDIVDAPFNERDYTRQYVKDDAHVFSTGKILNIPQEPVTRHDGQVRLFHTVKSPLFNPYGEVVMSVGVSRDITEYKQAQAELLEKTAELGRSNADREQLKLFAYAASHDLQEPLQKIVSFGDLLREHSVQKLDEKGINYLERMQNSAIRMGRVIDDLLKFAVVATQKQPLVTVDLEKLVSQVISDLEFRIQNAGARVEIGPLPVIRADALQMRQLFQNLIVNALKFRDRSRSAEILVSAEINGDQLEITVRDNGIGFDQKYADKIFNPFERLHTQEEFEGNGIGLAICKKIVARHGGRIFAKSHPGDGSTFVIQLPQGE